MEIHLDSEIFELVKSGTKTVEARVFDEKRQQIKPDDIITVFKRPDDAESLKIRVVGLMVFKDFSSLAEFYSMERLYTANTTKEEYTSLLSSFYSDDEVRKYGVVAIEFELI